MASPYRLLRDALWQLSLEPDEQRTALAGAAVNDELALDLNNAILSLAYASSTAVVPLAVEVVAAAVALDQTLSAPAADDLWDDESLDRHPTWARARNEARRLLELLPQPE